MSYSKASCRECGMKLEGSWSISQQKTDCLYTGVINGYMFSSGNSNYIYSYCLSCYKAIVIKYALEKLDLNKGWSDKMKELQQRINDLEEKTVLNEKLKQLESEFTKRTDRLI